MTATIDSNTISIMVNNTVEDIDKAMQILMTLRSEKRINAIEDYWNQFRNGPLRDKSRFSQVHNKNEYRNTGRPSTEPANEETDCNQSIYQSFEKELQHREKLLVVDIPSTRESHPHTGRISLKSRLTQLQM